MPLINTRRKINQTMYIFTFFKKIGPEPNRVWKREKITLTRIVARVLVSEIGGLKAMISYIVDLRQQNKEIVKTNKTVIQNKSFDMHKSVIKVTKRIMKKLELDWTMDF